MMVTRGKRRIIRKRVPVAHRVIRPRVDKPKLLSAEQTLRSLPFGGETNKETTTPQVEAFVAVFDLSGFTPFCNQAGSSGDVPVFLDDFTEWLFAKIEQENATWGGETVEPLWNETPFFAKFMGDGMLLLWDAENMTDRQIGRLTSILLKVCDLYRSDFYGKVSAYVNDPPKSIRCRISRGTVFPVNNGRDYVGHCINIAIHLLKYNLLSFCISSESFNITESIETSLLTQLIPISLPLSGIRTSEPAWVLSSEFESVKARNPLYFSSSDPK